MKTKNKGKIFFSTTAVLLMASSAFAPLYFLNTSSQPIVHNQDTVKTSSSQRIPNEPVASTFTNVLIERTTDSKVIISWAYTAGYKLDTAGNLVQITNEVVTLYNEDSILGGAGSFIGNADATSQRITSDNLTRGRIYRQIYLLLDDGQRFDIPEFTVEKRNYAKLFSITVDTPTISTVKIDWKFSSGSYAASSYVYITNELGEVLTPLVLATDKTLTISGLIPGTDYNNLTLYESNGTPDSTLDDNIYLIPPFTTNTNAVPSLISNVLTTGVTATTATIDWDYTPGNNPDGTAINPGDETIIITNNGDTLGTVAAFDGTISFSNLVGDTTYNLVLTLSDGQVISLPAFTTLSDSTFSQISLSPITTYGNASSGEGVLQLDFTWTAGLDASGTPLVEETIYIRNENEVAKAKVSSDFTTMYVNDLQLNTLYSGWTMMTQYTDPNNVTVIPDFTILPTATMDSAIVGPTIENITYNSADVDFYYLQGWDNTGAYISDDVSISLNLVAGLYDGQIVFTPSNSGYYTKIFGNLNSDFNYDVELSLTSNAVINSGVSFITTSIAIPSEISAISLSQLSTNTMTLDWLYTAGLDSSGELLNADTIEVVDASGTSISTSPVAANLEQIIVTGLTPATLYDDLQLKLTSGGVDTFLDINTFTTDGISIPSTLTNVTTSAIDQTTATINWSYIQGVDPQGNPLLNEHLQIMNGNEILKTALPSNGSSLLVDLIPGTTYDLSILIVETGAIFDIPDFNTLSAAVSSTMTVINSTATGNTLTGEAEIIVEFEYQPGLDAQGNSLGHEIVYVENAQGATIGYGYSSDPYISIISTFDPITFKTEPLKVSTLNSNVGIVPAVSVTVDSVPSNISSILVETISKTDSNLLFDYSNGWDVTGASFDDTITISGTDLTDIVFTEGDPGIFRIPINDLNPGTTYDDWTITITNESGSTIYNIPAFSTFFDETVSEIVAVDAAYNTTTSRMDVGWDIDAGVDIAGQLKNIFETISITVIGDSDNKGTEYDIHTFVLTAEQLALAYQLRGGVYWRPLNRYKFDLEYNLKALKTDWVPIPDSSSVAVDEMFRAQFTDITNDSVTIGWEYTQEELSPGTLSNPVFSIVGTNVATLDTIIWNGNLNSGTALFGSLKQSDTYSFTIYSSVSTININTVPGGVYKMNDVVVSHKTNTLSTLYVVLIVIGSVLFFLLLGTFLYMWSRRRDLNRIDENKYKLS